MRALLKKILRSKTVLTFGGRLIALWLRLVHKTTRLVNDPEEGYRRVEGHYPAIVALWHGQHFMVPLVKRKKDPFRALVSRSGDGHLNSVAAESLGVGVVRGSGGRNRAKTLSKGGISALKNLVSCLKEGVGVVMTVNVPKTGARECGLGVVTLAKLSGRPIIPAAYASSNRIDLDTWDKASINMPFGRAAFIIGDPIYVERDADEETLEIMRLKVESALNDVTREAYGRLKN
ncbi:lysophospholipid acyltransferase family protein [uncultured Cohaesibacter sp.]|uniref:lysophospholipid acyltransferase family protein n=1 Tax=uncultured Cohaesibacter sp. TaxID=1002546 RepID=UPI00292F516D|nr:lysophospholipid acyltransferase family protein [uncultured Cohaesibacter sp.]